MYILKDKQCTLVETNDLEQYKLIIKNLNEE